MAVPVLVLSAAIAGALAAAVLYATTGHVWVVLLLGPVAYVAATFSRTGGWRACRR